MPHRIWPYLCLIWSLTQGLVRSPGTFDAPWVNEYAPASSKPAAIGNTAEPLAVLKHIEDMTIKAVFWLKDFAKHLDDAEIARQFREVAQLFSQKRSALVLTGDDIQLPREVTHDAVFFNLKLPERDELIQTVTEVVRTLRNKHRTQVDLQEQDRTSLGAGLEWDDFKAGSPGASLCRFRGWQVNRPGCGTDFAP